MQAKISHFEENLNPAEPEKNGAKIVGYGEMSTVFRFTDPSMADYVFKRMAVFHSKPEVDEYEKIFYLYHEKLKERGIQTPPYGSCRVVLQNKIILYLIQTGQNSESIGQNFIQKASLAEIKKFYEKILGTIFLFQEKNLSDPDWNLGLDGQISNWTNNLLYIDTSTPLMQFQGKEQLNAELFLRICPKALRWVIRLFFLKDVLTRYYDMRLVIIDLIANLNKEQRPDLIPIFLEMSNQFMVDKNADWVIITEKDIQAYYREDALIWRIFLLFRKIERFLTRLRGGVYPMILPGKIKR